MQSATKTVSIEDQNRNGMVNNFTFIFKSNAISFSKLQSKIKQNGVTLAEILLPPAFNT